jgi:hypothetical protein
MTLAGFEPVIPASERPQTHALDRAIIGIGIHLFNKRGKKQSRYKPGVAQKVKVPRFHDNGTGWW